MNETTPIAESDAASLPEKLEDILAMRVVKHRPSFIDDIETLWKSIYEGGDYRRLNLATTNERAVTGMTIFDDYEVTKLLRKAAEQVGWVHVVDATPAQIHVAHQRVLRRHRATRKQRRKLASAK